MAADYINKNADLTVSCNTPLPWFDLIVMCGWCAESNWDLTNVVDFFHAVEMRHKFWSEDTCYFPLDVSIMTRIPHVITYGPRTLQRTDVLWCYSILVVLAVNPMNEQCFILFFSFFFFFGFCPSFFFCLLFLSVFKNVVRIEVITNFSTHHTPALTQTGDPQPQGMNPDHRTIRTTRVSMCCLTEGRQIVNIG